MVEPYTRNSTASRLVWARTLPFLAVRGLNGRTAARRARSPFFGYKSQEMGLDGMGLDGPLPLEVRNAHGR